MWQRMQQKQLLKLFGRCKVGLILVLKMNWKSVVNFILIMWKLFWCMSGCSIMVQMVSLLLSFFGIILRKMFVGSLFFLIFLCKNGIVVFKRKFWLKNWLSRVFLLKFYGRKLGRIWMNLILFVILFLISCCLCVKSELIVCVSVIILLNIVVWLKMYLISFWKNMKQKVFFCLKNVKCCKYSCLMKWVFLQNLFVFLVLLKFLMLLYGNWKLSCIKVFDLSLFFLYNLNLGIYKNEAVNILFIDFGSVVGQELMCDFVEVDFILQLISN